jgi:7-cyano-7-deazaguanine synthase in queuosine biosynthesis
MPNGFQADTVALFSGGLDSLAGAIDLMAASSSRVLLVGHYDSPGPRKAQATLAGMIKQRYPGRLDIVHVRVAHRPSKAAEETLRSRSLVFLALGLFAAQGFGPNVPLHMFENGLIALNVPLTPSRQGSCSTRTMHPYYLRLLRGLIPRLGIDNSIRNPYELKTKGECVSACSDAALLLELADGSVSCSHASRRQDWVRKSATNCGYCVPCLFRRAAMYRAGCDSGLKYGIDVLADEMTVDDPRESANDLRALVDFLRHTPTHSSLRKKIVAIAPVDDLEAHVSMACRGFAEVKQWLESSKIMKS